MTQTDIIYATLTDKRNVERFGKEEIARSVGLNTKF